MGDEGDGSASDEFLRAAAWAPAVEPPAPEPDLVGQTVGRFRLLTRLGQGGMGIVYRAKDSVLGREVALKVLPHKVMRDEGRRRRFLKEARLAAAISHPNLVAIYDVGEEGARIYLAMELVDGQLLRDKLASGPMPLGEVVRVGAELARGLARAHAAGIVHRDLKPENMMIATDGTVKILDFGIATIRTSEVHGTTPTESGGSESELGVVVGTPAYMSPEQAKLRDITDRSDCFALGVVLYEMLAGRRPFAGANAFEIVIAIDRDTPTRLELVRPDIPRSVADMVERCLAKRPDERPSAESIARSLSTLDLEAERQVSDRSRVRRRPGKAWLLGGAIVAGGMATAVALHQRAQPGSPLQTASSTPAPSASARETGGLEGSAVRMIDLPLPNTNDAASTAYKGAMSAYRDGAYARAAEGMKKAVELDPGLAAGHLRLAIWTNMDQVGARAHFREAQRYRDALTPRDRAVLAAVEPLFQGEIVDYVQASQRLSQLVQPGLEDAELWFFHGWLSGDVVGPHQAIASLERAVALDPGFGMPLPLLSLALLYDDRDGEAVLRGCMKAFPDATECRATAAMQFVDDGDCAELEAISRQTVRSAPSDANGYASLARALVARGADEAAVREVLGQKERASHQQFNPLAVPDKAVLALSDETNLRILAGDLAGAAKTAEELWNGVALEGGEPAHMAPARRIVELHLEMGALASAAAFSADYQRRRTGWVPDVEREDWAMARDPLPRLFRAELRAGTVSAEAHAKKHGEWLAQWESEALPRYRRWLWPVAFASTAETKEEADGALAALPRFAPVPKFRPFSYTDGEIGRVYLLAGRPREALPWLERAAKSCWALDAPIAHTRAHYFLGLTREALDDDSGACEAFAVVERRWGKSKGRSVTAEATKRRVEALGCR